MSNPKELTQIKQLAEKGLRWAADNDGKAAEIFGQILKLADEGDARTLSVEPSVRAARRKGKG